MKRKYAGMGVGELRRLKQLEEDNRKLKGLVVNLSQDKHILQEVITKKLRNLGASANWPIESSRGLRSARDMHAGCCKL